MRDIWIAGFLFAANLLILGPWLFTDFSNQPWNNGYMSLGVGRMFRDHKWTWNPYNYGGAPFRYLYLPLFHVITSSLPFHSIGRSFHLVTAVAYALTPVAMYTLCRRLFESRAPAIFAAVACSVFPAAAYLMPQWRNFTAPWFHAPWEFIAMVIYEETVHNCALPLTLLAIAAAWRNRRLLGSVLAAAVMLTSWPAVIGLCFVLAGLAVARTHDLGPWKSATRIIAMTGTAYGLSAFWITPAYFVSSSLLDRVVLRHVFSAEPITRATWFILIGAAILIGLSFLPRVPARLALPLVWSALTGAVVLSTLAGNTLVPLPNRYLLEFNAGMVVLAAALISLAPFKWQPWVAGVLTMAGIVAGLPFIAHAWKLQPRGQNTHTQVAWQVADWLNRHAGTSRIFATGELDGNLAVYSDVPQVGGIGQGVANPLVFAAERQIGYGCSADSAHVAELWLRALNIRYFVVHGADSREYYHWFTQPEKFAGLPVAWDDSAGDTIYRIQDSAPEAVVVDLNEMNRLPRLRSTDDANFLEAYVRWAAGKRPVALHWKSVDDGDLAADLAPGEAILVKFNNDPGWRASGATTRNDPIGFLLIQPKPGEQTIRLRFGAAWEAWLGRAITLFTILALLWVRGPRLWIAAVALIPTFAAYAILMARVPSTVAIAEDAFARLQPPIINPEGIVDGATNKPPPFGRGRAIAVYGQGFGDPKDTVRVFVADRPAEVLYHGPNMVTFRMPVDAPAQAAVSIEVNGCRGNEFTVSVGS